MASEARVFDDDARYSIDDNGVLVTLTADRKRVHYSPRILGQRERHQTRERRFQHVRSCRSVTGIAPSLRMFQNGAPAASRRRRSLGGPSCETPDMTLRIKFSDGTESGYDDKVDYTIEDGGILTVRDGDEVRSYAAHAWSVVTENVA